ADRHHVFHARPNLHRRAGRGGPRLDCQRAQRRPPPSLSAARVMPGSWLRRRAAPAAIMVAVALFPARSAAQGNIDQQLRSNRERLDEIRKERDALRDELEHLRGRAHDITGELSNLERQKGVTSRIVNELDRQMGSMHGQLDTLSLSLTLAQDNLAEK